MHDSKVSINSLLDAVLEEILLLHLFSPSPSLDNYCPSRIAVHIELQSSVIMGQVNQPRLAHFSTRNP